MEHLTLVGLTEDKTTLVLASDSGEEFTLAADARLRAALRGEHPRLGQLEIQMDSALRPRDIQARIRAGESPETVAAAAQTTVDKIMGFATPVLAERAHIAQRAQRSSVRRRAGEGPARLLGDAVAERLSARNLDPESVEWDAWRREDGRWTLVADYRSGESLRHAEFSYDAPGRYVVAEDDEARWLVGEQSTARGPQPRSGGIPRRLSAVVSEGELPFGADAIDLVRDTPAEEERPDEERTVDLSQAAESVRRHPSSPDPAAETADADWMTDRPEAAPTPTADDEPEDDRDEAATAPRRDTGERTEPAEAVDEQPEQPAEPERPAKKSGRKGRRASVPSWDEIMFGGGKQDG